MEPEKFYHRCLRHLFPAATSRWSSIALAYDGRAYHNLDHLREMLSHLPALHPSPAPAAPPAYLLTDKQALFGLALIYHDVVYKAGKKDNEAGSADLLAKHISEDGGLAEQADYCRKLILATKTHTLSDPADRYEALLLDLDLAVLARPTAGYDAYARAVRREFRWFPNVLYRPGRRKALRHLLDQPYLYQSSTARQMWESDARANLTRELKTLR